MGVILDELDALGLTEHTMVMFASDNGHELDYREEGRASRTHTLEGAATDNLHNPFRSASCLDVFNGNAGMAGLKFTNWDGGSRIPFMVRWPEVIKPGEVSNQLVAHYDVIATVADVVGAPAPQRIDGLSFLPMLKKEKVIPEHDYVVFSCHFGPALVTKAGWKLRTVIPSEMMEKASITYEGGVDVCLYHVLEDPAEESECSATNPEITKALRKLLIKECDGNLLNGTPGRHYTRPDYYIPEFADVVKGVI